MVEKFSDKYYKFMIKMRKHIFSAVKKYIYYIDISYTKRFIENTFWFLFEEIPVQ